MTVGPWKSDEGHESKRVSGRAKAIHIAIRVEREELFVERAVRLGVHHVAGAGEDLEPGPAERGGERLEGGAEVRRGAVAAEEQRRHLDPAELGVADPVGAERVAVAA